MSAAAATIIAGVGAAASVGGVVASASSAKKGRKAVKKAQDTAAARVDSELEGVRNFEFKNVYEGLGDAASYDPTQVEAATAGATGYDPTQAQAGTLGAAQGYQGQGYSAGQVSLRNLAGGADFLSNPFANLQVGTAAADLQGAQTDQALAASLESGAITGGGGATALARAAAGSKAGISANIQQQELQNSQLRAQGQQTLEQGLLAQSNAANQFGFQQDSFNVGQSNQAAAFTASAQNQANQFNAGQSNQFALQQFGADNQFAQFNAQAANQADAHAADAQNRTALQNAQFQNQANQFNAQALTQRDQFDTENINAREQQRLQAADALQQREYDRNVNLVNAASGQAAQSSSNAIAAQDARARSTANTISGIGQAANLASSIDFSSNKSAVDTSQFGFGKSGGPGGNFNLLQGR